MHSIRAPPEERLRSRSPTSRLPDGSPCAQPTRPRASTTPVSQYETSLTSSAGWDLGQIVDDEVGSRALVTLEPASLP